jgi:hypothetical protein
MQPVGKAGAVGPREAAWRHTLHLGNVLRLQSPLDDNVGLLITLHLLRVEVLQDVSSWQAVVAGSAVCGLARTA